MAEELEEGGKKGKAPDLDSIMAKLTKDNPEMIFNGDDAALRDKRIVFDSPRLTWAYGAFKLNAIHRLNGKESGGKTTIATYIAAQCQKRKFEEEGNYSNAHVAILDYEHSFDVIRAKQLGLLLKDPITGKNLVHVVRPMYVEDGQAWWEQMVKSGQLCCTIFDSDAAAPNKTELDGEIGKANFGAGAKAVGICIKRMNIYVDMFCTPVIWISQERANQEMMAHLPQTTGGYAVNYYASTRFRVTQGNPTDFPKQGGETIGIIIRLKNYKNKTAIPGREAFLTMLFNGGISSDDEYIEMATELGVMEQRGAWFWVWNPYKDMTAEREISLGKDSKSKKAVDAMIEAGDLVKCNGGVALRDWWKSDDKADWKKMIKDAVNAKLLVHDDILDAHTGEEDEEAQYQKEVKAEKARKEAAEAPAEEEPVVDKEAELEARLAQVMSEEIPGDEEAPVGEGAPIGMSIGDATAVEEVNL